MADSNSKGLSMLFLAIFLLHGRMQQKINPRFKIHLFSDGVVTECKNNSLRQVLFHLLSFLQLCCFELPPSRLCVSSLPDTYHKHSCRTTALFPCGSLLLTRLGLLLHVCARINPTRRAHRLYNAHTHTHACTLSCLLDRCSRTQ